MKFILQILLTFLDLYIKLNIIGLKNFINNFFLKDVYKKNLINFLIPSMSPLCVDYGSTTIAYALNQSFTCFIINFILFFDSKFL